MAVQVLFHNQSHEYIEVIVLVVVLDVQDIQIIEYISDVVYHILAYDFDECCV